MLLPMLASGVLVSARRKDVAKRLSSMTGYTGKEKLVTVTASLLPYPFMGVAIVTPLRAVGVLLFLGVLSSLIGSIGFAATLHVFANTPDEQPLQAGPFRLSRNPLYVSAALVFAGVCLATGSLLLAGILAILLMLQHFMILAEERACRSKYGEVYLSYSRKRPRYLGWTRD